MTPAVEQEKAGQSRAGTHGLASATRLQFPACSRVPRATVACVTCLLSLSTGTGLWMPAHGVSCSGPGSGPPVEFLSEDEPTCRCSVEPLQGCQELDRISLAMEAPA